MMTRICDRCEEPVKGAIPFGQVKFGQETTFGQVEPKDVCQKCLDGCQVWWDSGKAS